MILLIELILREIRAKVNLEANSVSTTKEPLNPRSLNLLIPMYYWLTINNLNLYNNTYGFRPNISGSTLIGDPKYARYRAEYTIYGDLEKAEQLIREYYSKHVGERYTIDGITATISCPGDVKLILIANGTIQGDYTISEIK